MGPKRNYSRRGQSLMAIFVLLMVLIGVLALTLDLGFVLLSRRAMQTGVNTAALEGARDIEGLGRENARTLMQNVYDDNLDPTQNFTTLGVGPSQSLVQVDSNGSAVLGAGQGAQPLLDNRHQYIYRPVPQLNTINEVSGDLVQGNYDDTNVGALAHVENQNYERNDFSTDDLGSAFLSRLRRTPSRSGVANELDRVAGVSSSGSGSPLLLGRLAFFSPSPANSYDIRRDGVTIRATAIADSKPIVSVGRGEADEIFSAIPYAYSVETNQWYELASSTRSLGQVAQLVDQDPTDPDIDPIDYNDIDLPGYAAIIWEYEMQNYVVGFALVDLGEERVPNGSPRLQDAWPTLETLPAVTRDALLAKHYEIAEGGLPALARLPAQVRTVH